MEKHLEPGGAYHYTGWSKPDFSKQQRNPSIDANALSEFDEWKTWMNKYVAENNKKEEQKKKTKKIKPLDVAWETRIGEVRELQKRKAEDIAKAITCGKKSNKLAEIFKKRFERSEKYAIVSEPRKQEEKQEEDREKDEDQTKLENIQEEEASTETPVTIEEEQDEFQPQVAIETSFLLPKDPLFQAPTPWMHKVESLPTPPPRTNFNRTPKLFSSSYTSPYYY